MKNLISLAMQSCFWAGIILISTSTEEAMSNPDQAYYEIMEGLESPAENVNIPALPVKAIALK